MSASFFRVMHAIALASIAACVIGCNREAIQTSVTDLSYADSSRTSPSRLQSTDSDVTLDDVAAKEAELKATVAELAAIEQAIASIKSAVAAANEKASMLPQQIVEMRKSLSQLDEIINAKENQVETARSAYSDFATVIEQRKAAARTTIAATVNEQYNKQVADFIRARRERDELRARIGARGDTQSEAQLQALLVRQARDHAQKTFAAKVADAYAQIDSEANFLISRHSLAANQLVNLREERAATQRAITEKSDELVVQRQKSKSLPSELTHLCNRRSALVAQKEQQSRELAVVQATLRRNELIADQRRKQEQQNQQAATVTATSPPIRGYVSNRISNSAYPVAYRTYSGATSNYYNPSYRPPVGNHYVRPHFRRDGTFVRGHRRTNRDGSFWNNWSSKGNINPYTGRVGTQLPPYYRGASASHSYGKSRSDGTSAFWLLAIIGIGWVVKRRCVDRRV